jgi:hypothetical protein
MSSKSQNKAGWEARLLVLSMFLMLLWYAWPQLPYSLFILYDVIRTINPALLPSIPAGLRG